MTKKPKAPKTAELEKLLTPAQIELLESKVMEAEMPVDDWISLLVACQKFDRSNDEERGTTSGFLALGVVGCIISLIMVAVMPLVGAPLFILSGIGAGIAGAKLSKLKSLDFDSELTQACIPILALIREDMQKGAPVRLKLDIRGPLIKDKLVEKPVQLTNTPRGVKAILSRYRDEWFSGEAPLRDGTRIRWQIADDIKSVKKSRRNPRGKLKEKTKTRRNTEITMQIRFPEERYSFADAQPSFANSNNLIRVVRQGNTVKTFCQMKNVDLNSEFLPDRFMRSMGEAFRLAAPKSGKAQ